MSAEDYRAENEEEEREAAERRGWDLHGGCETCGASVDNPQASYGLKVCATCYVKRRQGAHPAGQSEGEEVGSAVVDGRLKPS